jgi:large subunit ribosomal protein L10
MRREEKAIKIKDLKERISNSNHFYLTDTSTLNAEQTSKLRRKCFENDITLLVVKNTLLKKALDSMDADYESLYGVLENSTSVMFCQTANVPAKLIKEFRRKSDRPVLKAAYVEESIFVGDEQLETLASLKSKNELIADVLALLQSPIQGVLSGLSSGGSRLAGALKTLTEK